MIFSLSLLLPILIIAIIALIVAAAKGESKGKGGGDQLIKNVYVYLVLFATLMMAIGGSVAVFMAVADLVAPAPYHQSFEEFKRWGLEKPYADNQAAEEIKLSEEELKERYDAMVQEEKERQSVRAKNSLIKSFGWIIIPLPVFLFFQRRLIKNRD